MDDRQRRKQEAEQYEKDEMENRGFHGRFL